MPIQESESAGVEALPKSDEDLAREANAENLDAFEELVLRRRSGLVRFLAGFTQSTSDAEDLTQETFLRAYRRLDLYDPEKPFLPWLYVIARRLALNYFRKRARQRETNLQEGEGKLQGEDSTHDDLDSLWKAASMLLSPDSYTAMRLHYGEDMPLKEIAQVLQKSLTATKVMLFRARKLLAEKVDSETYEPKAHAGDMPQ